MEGSAGSVARGGCPAMTHLSTPQLGMTAFTIVRFLGLIPGKGGEVFVGVDVVCFVEVGVGGGSFGGLTEAASQLRLRRDSESAS